MSVLLSVLLATAIIAALIVLRIVIDQRAFAARLPSNRADSACDAHECFHGCGPDRVDSAAQYVPERHQSKRSPPHAS